MNAIVHSGAFPDHYGQVEFKRGSAECLQLEGRYPGIRFNRVMISVFALFYFQHAPPDEDYIEIVFNVSGTDEAMRRHGFDQPQYVGSRVRTVMGCRMNYATYNDGLDRIAALFMAPLLKKFSRKEASK